MIPHPLCFARWLWRSFSAGAWVEGHDFVEIEEPTPPNVHVLQCETCAEISVSWDWGPIERHPSDRWIEYRVDPD